MFQDFMHEIRWDQSSMLIHNMTESELGAVSTECLYRPIPNNQMWTSETTAWQENRNKHPAKVDWQFTTTDARVRLKRLHPQFQRLGH
jgi:hypothetical protein